MKNFAMDKEMLSSIGGVFYPTGHSIVMFPSSEDALKVGRALVAQQIASGDEVYVIPSAQVLAQIAPTVSEADNPLPSAGTEGAVVRALTRLARDGHAGLLVRTPDEEAAERLMAVVRTVPYSMAQRYRRLVIEDL